MSKFTRGTWHYFHPNGCIHCDGKLIAEVTGAGGPKSYRHAQGEANARLIAAAPEMYETLELCAKVLYGHNEFAVAQKVHNLLARIDGEKIDNG